MLCDTQLLTALYKEDIGENFLKGLFLSSPKKTHRVDMTAKTVPFRNTAYTKRNFR